MRADPTSYTLATNTAATGASVPVRGGIYLFTVEGTVGGSTLSLQVQTVNGTWVDLAADGVTSTIKTTTLPFAYTGIYLPAGNVRAAITGGAASAVYAYLTGIG